ncbi:unnamed protein product, partial [Ilex paraguariensis]
CHTCGGHGHTSTQCTYLRDDIDRELIQLARQSKVLSSQVYIGLERGSKIPPRKRCCEPNLSNPHEFRKQSKRGKG